MSNFVVSYSSSRLSRRAVGPEYRWACGPPKKMKMARTNIEWVAQVWRLQLDFRQSVPGFPATRRSPTAMCAVPARRDRMKFDDATSLDRKSGGAEWRACPERSRTGTCCFAGETKSVSCPRGSAKPVVNFKESRRCEPRVEGNPGDRPLGPR